MRVAMNARTPIPPIVAPTMRPTGVVEDRTDELDTDAVGDTTDEVTPVLERGEGDEKIRGGLVNREVADEIEDVEDKDEVGEEGGGQLVGVSEELEVTNIIALVVIDVIVVVIWSRDVVVIVVMGAGSVDPDWSGTVYRMQSKRMTESGVSAACIFSVCSVLSSPSRAYTTTLNMGSGLSDGVCRNVPSSAPSRVNCRLLVVGVPDTAFASTLTTYTAVPVNCTCKKRGLESVVWCDVSCHVLSNVCEGSSLTRHPLHVEP